MTTNKAFVAFILFFPIASTLTASQRLVPAGSIVQCRISEKISSLVTDVGDPITCEASHGQLPYGATLVGTFQDYKDPGHFIGKGWMELSFDRVILPGNRIVQLSAKVVEGPGYRVDKTGKILGKGHAIRDTVEWLIPVLWPIDLLNLPRRGPRPVLKAETKLSLKIMDDLTIPVFSQVADTYVGQQEQDYSQPQADENGFAVRPQGSTYEGEQQGSGTVISGEAFLSIGTANQVRVISFKAPPPTVMRLPKAPRASRSQAMKAQRAANRKSERTNERTGQRITSTPARSSSVRSSGRR